MSRLRVVSDPAECRRLWRIATPDALVTDLWETRACFHRHYRRRLHFVVAEDRRGLAGLLPLCWIDEQECYGYFPGETWEGHTWLEQNRLPVRSPELLETMLSSLGERYHLRYLMPTPLTEGPAARVDEIGYLFVPARYGSDFDGYLRAFSSRSARRLRRLLSDFDQKGVTFRRGDPSDFDSLVQLNLGRFGERSYFHDPRFRRSFRDLAALLERRGWLRMTTVLVGGEPAAVDMGCIYRGVYTLLAGGTHPDHPGVAKLINLHHMRRASEEGLDWVDFLCGDFSWKSLFHLVERPLLLLSNVDGEPARVEAPSPAAVASAMVP